MYWVPTSSLRTWPLKSVSCSVRYSFCCPASLGNIGGVDSPVTPWHVEQTLVAMASPVMVECFSDCPPSPPAHPVSAPTDRERIRIDFLKTSVMSTFSGSFLRLGSRYIKVQATDKQRLYYFRWHYGCFRRSCSRRPSNG